jgi:hypothetical protein
MIFDNCIEKSHLISAEQCSVTFMERAPCEERRMRHPQRGIAIEGQNHSGNSVRHPPAALRSVRIRLSMNFETLRFYRLVQSAGVVGTRLLIMFTFCMIGALTLAQSSGTQEPPKEVVERFCKLDAAGVRLRPEGWNRTAEFFVRPVPKPSNMPITVMKGSFVVGNPRIEGEKATVGVEYLKLGRLDNSMRFKGAAGYSGPVKARRYFTLVLSAADKASSNDRGKLNWKIVEAQSEPIVTLETAIEYVEFVRDKSRNSVIRKNAEKTLSSFQRLETQTLNEKRWGNLE